MAVRNPFNKGSDFATLFEALQQSQAQLLRGLMGTSSGADESPLIKEAADNIKDVNEKTEKLSKALESVIVEVHDQEDALEKANKSLLKSTKSFGDLDSELAELWGKSLPQARIYLKDYSQATKNLTNELAKTLRTQSLFGASMLESHNEIKKGTLQYHSMMEDMYNASDGLNKGILQQAKVWDENTQAIQKNLSPIDFARLHVAIGQAQTAIVENIGGAEGLGKLSALASMSEEDFAKTISANSEAGKKLQAAMFATVAQLEAMGNHLEIEGPSGTKEHISLTNGNGQINQKAIDDLQADSTKMQKVTKALLDATAKNRDANEKFGDIAWHSGTIIGSWTNKVTNVIGDFRKIDGAAELLKRAFFALADTALIKKSFDLMKEGLKETYKNLMDFNIAQVPASFANVNYASMKLGLSFQDTVKFMQENKRAMAIYGAGFDNLTSSLKGTFQKFGYTFQQGAEVVGPAFEAAIATGINVKNGDALNKFVDQTMESFKKVAGIVNMTAAEYAKMNAQLLDSTEVQGTLLGLDQDTAQARAKDLIALRDHYLAEGISADMANELIRAQQAQKNEPVKEQITNAAKEAFAAQYAGMSGAQAQEIQQLAMLGQARTKEQNDRLEELRKETQVGLAQRRSGANATNDVGVVLSNQIGEQYANSTSGESAAGQAAARKAAEFEKANAGVTPEQQKAAADKAAGSKELSFFGNIVNSVSSVLKNSLVTSTIGAAGSLFGLMAQSILTARALGKLGGGIGDFLPGGKFLDKLKTGIGKMFGGGGATKVAEEGATKVAEKGATKVAEEGATKVAEKTGVSVAEKAVEKEGGEVLAKEGGKIAAKGLGKSLLKKIPLIGLLAGGLFAGQRALSGDFTGAGLELASGAAGTIPGIGTAASIGIDAALAGRDIYKASQPNAEPVSGTPPSVGQPGARPEAGQVNTAEAAPGATPSDTAPLTITDPTAHDYLSTIADSMVAAVKLLQAISDNGNPAAADVVAQRLKDAGVKKLPNATTYMTGRLAAT